MSQEQQETDVSGAPKASSVIAAIVLIGAAGAIYWLGWGSDGSDAPAAKPVAAPPAKVAQTQPAGPMPTIHGGLSARPAYAPFPADNGEFDFGGVAAMVGHYDDRWVAIDQHFNFTPEQGYPRRITGLFELKGKWQVFNGTFDWQETVKRGEGESVDYEVVVKSDQPVVTNALALGLLLPPKLYGGEQILVDGQPLILKSAVGDPGILSRPAVKRLDVATPTGRVVIEGEFPMNIQDNRPYGQDAFQVRIGFTPQNGQITEARLKLKLSRMPGALQSLGTSEPAAVPTGPEQAKPQ